jgi:hypothetical protein
MVGSVQIVFMLNTEKTIAMAYHNRQERDLMKPQIKFGKTQIVCRSETKCLCTHVNEHMDWNAHIVFLSLKLSKVCYMIKFLRDVTSPPVIRSVYFAHCHAHLKYGLVFWGDNRKGKTIFKLQKRVVRTISGVSRRYSCRQLFKDLNLLPVPCVCVCVYIWNSMLY